MEYRFNLEKAKQMGYTDEQIQQMIAQGPPQPPQQQQPQSQSQVPQEEGRQGLAKWLPLIGGVVGGVAGAPLGGVGAIGGGAAGSGAGEWLAQFLSGEDTDVKDIGKETALGLIGGVGGRIAAPVARTGLNLLRGGSRAGAQIASQTGAEALEQGTRVATSQGPQIGARTYASAFNVPTRAARWVKPVETSQELIDHGVGGSLTQIKAKSGEALQTIGDLRRNMLSQVPGEIDIKSIGQTVTKGLDNVVDLSKSDASKIVSTITRSHEKVMGSAPHTINAVDALDHVQELRRIGVQWMNQSTRANPNLRAEQIGDVFMRAADDIERAMDKALRGKGLDIIQAFKTPEIIARIQAISPKLAQQFRDAKDLKDIGSLMKPFVRANQLVNMTEEAAQSTGSSISNRVLSGLILGGGGLATGGPMAIPAAAAGFAGAPILEGLAHAARAPISSTAGRLIAGMGSRAGRAGQSDLLQSLIQSGGGQTASRAIFDPSDPNIIEGQLEDQPSSILPGGVSGDMDLSEGSVQGDNVLSQILGQNPQETLRTLAVLDLLQGGDNTSSLISLAKLFEEDSAPTTSKSGTAMNVLSQLEGLYGDVQGQGLTAQSGGVGRLIGMAKGNLAALSQTSPEASTYKDQVEAFMSLISRGLGESGVLTDRDVERVRKAIPTFSDTPQTAARKFALIQSILETAEGSSGQGTSIDESTNEPSFLQFLQ